MKITICGSIAFIDEMVEAQRFLESQGHEVKLPELVIPDGNGGTITAKEWYEIRKSWDNSEWISERKGEAIRWHFEKINWSDAILVLNYDKNWVAGYVWGNTLLEMGHAFHFRKKIYMLNWAPDISYTEEIVGMQPTVIHGDLSKIG